MSNPFEELRDFMENRFCELAKTLGHVESTLSSHSQLLSSREFGEDSPFLTRKEAAKLLRCSATTIDNYRRSGKLTRARLGGNEGRKVLFLRDDVLKLKEL
jgi:excisionase family DNA binding protein